MIKLIDKKKLTLVFMIVLVLCLIFTNNYAQEAESKTEEPEKIIEGKPLLDFEDYIHDFGEVFQDTVSKHIFRFKNPGTGTLVIERVQATCGCTVPELQDKILQSGESGELEVNFKSGKFKGPQHKTIKIASNDAITPLKVITIKAYVKRSIEVLPNKINIPEIEQEKEHTEKITIRNNDKKLHLEILNVEIKLPEEISTDFKGPFILKPGTEKVINLKIFPIKYRAKITSYIRFHTNFPKLPEITIPIQVAIKPDVRGFDIISFFILAL